MKNLFMLILAALFLLAACTTEPNKTDDTAIRSDRVKTEPDPSIWIMGNINVQSADNDVLVFQASISIKNVDKSKPDEFSNSKIMINGKTLPYIGNGEFRLTLAPTRPGEIIRYTIDHSRFGHLEDNIQVPPLVMDVALEPELIPGSTLHAHTAFHLTWKAEPGIQYTATHFNYDGKGKWLSGYGLDLMKGQYAFDNAGENLRVAVCAISTSWISGFHKWSRIIVHGKETSFASRDTLR